MRNRYVDLLRAGAIARVVVYHVTGWAVLSIVFPAMSVMFALAGSLMAASLDRHGARAVGRRLRRLLPSLWVQAAVFVPAMMLTGLAVDWRLVLWATPLLDPPANRWGALALSVIWYLRDYLWFVLLSPLALPLFRRFPVATIAAPYALLVVIEFGGIRAPNVVRDIGLYFGAWMLGFAHHDGMLRRMPRWLLLPLAGVLAASGAAWFLTHPGRRGFDLNDIHLGNALWSAAFVLVALGCAPSTMAWLNHRAALTRLVTVLNSRALTIYLWHMPMVIGVGAVASLIGWPLSGTVGLGVRLLIVAVLVAGAVAAFGWVEDLAARRRPVLLPGARPSVARSAAGPPAVPASRQPVASVPASRPLSASVPASRPLSASVPASRQAATPVPPSVPPPVPPPDVALAEPMLVRLR